MEFETIIFNNKGELFRFKKGANGYRCTTCFWHGDIKRAAAGGWTAEIGQSCEPFDHEVADPPFPKLEEAMHWITGRLLKTK